MGASSFGLTRAAAHGMLVASLALCAAPAYAAAIVVNSLADTSGGSECTLRNAITAANTDSPTGGCPAGSGADTITFNLSGTIALGSLLVIEPGSTVTVDGSGQTIMISGQQTGHVMLVEEAATLHLRRVHVADSAIAAVRNLGGTITVSDSTFSGNRGWAGAAIDNLRGHLAVDNTTFTGNSASFGTIQNGFDSTAILRNITVSHNSGDPVGGINNDGVLTLLNSTVYGNSGYGLRISDHVPGVLNIGNTILAKNGSPDCRNETTSFNVLGPNLIEFGDALCPGTLTDDPLLGPLADNGGPTLTRALLPGSPAIDAGGASVCADLAADQRGALRSVDGDFDGNAVCDLGAFEFADEAPVATADVYVTNANTPLTVPAPGVLANDQDPEGDPMTAVLVNPPTHATAFTLNANGSFTYSPAANYSGPDGFTYTARDAIGATSTVVAATITVAEPSCGITLTPATLAQPYVAIPYLQGLGTSASGKYTYSVTAGALPPGVQLASALGVSGLIGIPQTPGTYAFTITAAKTGTNCRASRSYTVTVPKTIVPLLTCVQKVTKTTYRGTFGYDNTTGAAVIVPVGSSNYFTPGAQNRGQLTTFAPGLVKNAFSVTFTVDRDDPGIAVWVLRGPDNQKRLVTVTKSTYGCQ